VLGPGGQRRGRRRRGQRVIARQLEHPADINGGINDDLLIGSQGNYTINGDGGAGDAHEPRSGDRGGSS